MDINARLEALAAQRNGYKPAREIVSQDRIDAANDLYLDRIDIEGGEAFAEAVGTSQESFLRQGYDLDEAFTLAVEKVAA